MGVRATVFRKLTPFLLITLLCHPLVGCSDDETGTPKNHDSSDAAERRDAGDAGATADSGDGDSTRDGGPVTCKSDDECVAGPHQAAICDTALNTCVFACDEGFDDCNSDPTDGCEVDLRSDAAHCGACGNACASNSLHYAPICVPDGESTSTCDIDSSHCQDGFVDLNGEADDGCECEITDAADPIDPAGVDTNCDGVDGVLQEAVYVAPGGDDEAGGLAPGEAVATLGVALEKAADEGRSRVLVAGGEYVGQVSLREGIDIHGGFSADFSARDTAATPTRIIAGEDALDAEGAIYVTVVAEALTAPTVLDGVTVVGFDATEAGSSTAALRADQAPGLSLKDATLIGGVAAPGAAVEDGEDAVICEDNQGGAGGVANDEAANTPCNPNANNTSEVGSNGDQYVYTDDNNDTNDFGVGGKGGAHYCGSDPQIDELKGKDGRPGKEGVAGEAGELPAAGDFGHFDANGRWIGATGVGPKPGKAGGGGGGGGAGGNVQATAGAGVSLGGNGGTGGDGGCGGAAGQNGQPGGSSFALIVLGAPIDVASVEIALGQGGDGGDGSDGGSRGIGADGSAGERGPAATNGALRGGWGGNGGDGGHGGNGGNGAGGQGGNAIGIATADANVDDSGVTFSGGAAGSGGAGGAQAEDGRDGLVENIRPFDAAD